MALIKKELTEEEKKERQEQISFNRKYSGFKRTLKSLCAEKGVKAMELRLEYLKGHPQTLLPKGALNHQQTVSCYTEAINEYKESIGA